MIENKTSIILTNPKYDYNVAGAIRAVACFGYDQIIYTGNRANTSRGRKFRLPREERLKAFQHVNVINDDYPFDFFNKDLPKVAVEIRDNSESLYNFIHPKEAVYVFGPEDGSIKQTFLQYCHRFVYIPTYECLNLVATINIVLYDRNKKL